MRVKGQRPHRVQRMTGADISEKVNRKEAVTAEGGLFKTVMTTSIQLFRGMKS